MRRVIKLTVIALLAATAALLAACGSTQTVVQRANSFEGGALSNFGGPDGADSAARATARAIAGNRGYDCTATDYTLAGGAVTSWAILGTADYQDATGTLAIDASNATVTLAIPSGDPAVSNVQLSGTFDAAEGQAAIDNPGSSFIVQWTISWEAGGAPFTLTAEQTLLGSDWIEQ